MRRRARGPLFLDEEQWFDGLDEIGGSRLGGGPNLGGFNLI
jgi:hypothetical protein